MYLEYWRETSCKTIFFNNQDGYRRIILREADDTDSGSGPINLSFYFCVQHSYAMLYTEVKFNTISIQTTPWDSREDKLLMLTVLITYNLSLTQQMKQNWNPSQTTWCCTLWFPLNMHISPPICHFWNGHIGFMAMSELFWLGENIATACAGGLLTNNQLYLLIVHFTNISQYKYCRCVTHVANPT